MTTIQRMDPELKARWIADLRSGLHTQGQGVLHQIDQYFGEDHHSYCCLGRLCEVMEIPNVPERSGHVLRRQYDGFTGRISGGTARKAGISADISPLDSTTVPLGFYDRDVCVVTLAVANDNGCDFNQIADLIDYFL